MTKKTSRGTEAILESHLASGTFFSVNGLRTFALDIGKGEVVLCIHGVPTSSFLYRKVLRSLKIKGYRGISIDLPGLGLTDRPKDFDYTFPSFSDFLSQALIELKIKTFHLVVHDIGGPIGFALAAKHQDKILSLSILNTWIDVVKYKKPLVMKPFEVELIGEAELKAISPITWPLMFNNVGVLNSDTVSTEEKNVYIALLKRDDGGRAFLKIMRNFLATEEFRSLCYKAVQNVPYPVQAIWGEKDPALTLKRYGKEIQEVARLESITLLPSRHLLQEEVWVQLADEIDKIIKQAHLK